MKKILLALLGLVVLVLAIAAFMPKDFKIEKEIVINKSKPHVFYYLRMLQNEKAWNPWIKKDPQVVQTYKGEDGSVGFVSSWSGNSDVGVGEAEITGIVPDERIDMELRFQKPMKATHKASYVVESVGEKETKVTWTMVGRTEFPMNLICHFMQKQVNKEFENGLKNLKEVLEENHHEGAAAHDVK